MTLAKNRDKVSIGITSSNFILYSVFGCTTVVQGSILCSHILIYIKSCSIHC